MFCGVFKRLKLRHRGLTAVLVLLSKFLLISRVLFAKMLKFKQTLDRIFKMKRPKTQSPVDFKEKNVHILDVKIHVIEITTDILNTKLIIGAFCLSLFLLFFLGHLALEEYSGNYSAKSILEFDRTSFFVVALLTLITFILCFNSKFLDMRERWKFLKGELSLDLKIKDFMAPISAVEHISHLNFILNHPKGWVYKEYVKNILKNRELTYFEYICIKNEFKTLITEQEIEALKSNVKNYY